MQALSEVLEVFRADAQEIVKKLRIERSKPFSAKIANLDEKRLQNDLNNILDCYWLVHRGFYQAYDRAMKICEIPETYRYDKYTKPTEMKKVA